MSTERKDEINRRYASYLRSLDKHDYALLSTNTSAPVGESTPVRSNYGEGKRWETDIGSLSDAELREYVRGIFVLFRIFFPRLYSYAGRPHHFMITVSSTHLLFRLALEAQRRGLSWINTEPTQAVSYENPAKSDLPPPQYYVIFKDTV